MQQFVIPQFIDIEDQVIGPVTVRQFFIILTWMVFSGIIYALVDFVTFAFITGFLLILTIIVAFVRINGQPFHFFILNFMQTFSKPRLLLWLKPEASARIRGKHKKKEDDVVSDELLDEIMRQKQQLIYGGHLKDLALIVNTGGVYQGSGTTQRSYDQEVR